jgi:hypothetical protein
MITGRGRETRIRPQYRGLYEGLQGPEWEPVESMLERVADLPPEVRGKVASASRSRVLPDDHFEFRGTSPRPEGFPPQLSRVTDASEHRERAADLEGKLEAEQDQLSELQREADQSITRAEQLRERAELLHRDFERLRRRAAQLDLHPEPKPQREPGEPAPE